MKVERAIQMLTELVEYRAQKVPDKQGREYTLRLAEAVNSIIDEVEEKQRLVRECERLRSTSQVEEYRHRLQNICHLCLLPDEAAELPSGWTDMYVQDVEKVCELNEAAIRSMSPDTWVLKFGDFKPRDTRQLLHQIIYDYHRSKSSIDSIDFFLNMKKRLLQRYEDEIPRGTDGRPDPDDHSNDEELDRLIDILNEVEDTIDNETKILERVSTKDFVDRLIRQLQKKYSLL